MWHGTSHEGCPREENDPCPCDCFEDLWNPHLQLRSRLVATGIRGGSGRRRCARLLVKRTGVAVSQQRPNPDTCSQLGSLGIEFDAAPICSYEPAGLPGDGCSQTRWHGDGWDGFGFLACLLPATMVPASLPESRLPSDTRRFTVDARLSPAPLIFVLDSFRGSAHRCPLH